MPMAVMQIWLLEPCLEEWKRQMNRDESEEEDAQEEARKVLNLKSGDGSKELRRAYRSLARKYHPDKVRDCVQEHLHERLGATGLD